MPMLKRNLWTLFRLLLLGGCVLLLVILYYRWLSIYRTHELHHRSRAELVGQSVDSVLRTQELVLDVIGRELLGQQQMLDSRRQLPLLDNILAVDKPLIGFGLARLDGTLVRVSSNLDLSRLPNLRQHPATRDSFLLALESESMVLGRTYYLDALDDWVIPIRKALRDDTGQAVAVMTAGLRIGGDDTVFGRKLYDGDDDRVLLFREADGYVQFISSHNASHQAYTQPLATLAQRPLNRREYEAQLDMTVAEVKALGRAVSLKLTRDDETYLSAALFNPRYQLWVLSETRMAPIIHEFLATAGLYLLIFLGIGSLLWWLFHIIERAESKRRRELLYHSTHDDLTGLLNRAGLLDRLSELMQQQQPFSLVVINIDNFKGINDRFGQTTGDSALIEFAHRLKVALDENDCLARLGSDEFVITTDNTDLSTLKEASQALLEQLAHGFETGRLRIQLTASAGVACFPEHGDSASKLMRSAHLALYKAKQSRNAVSLYLSEMELAYLRRLTVEQRLRLALAQGGLHMVYQPQLDERGQIVGLEALVRWQDEELGFVSPAEFVEVAEQSGLMLALGRFVLDTSLSEYQALRRHLQRPLDLAINISVIQFEQPDFVTDILALLHRWQVPAEELVLEITESLIMNQVDQVMQTITALHRQQIRLSLDDFGTGYSSLSLLRTLPIDELKIDKSFVDNLLDDTRASNMIQSIIHIARTHGMDVVVEGVERPEQAHTLIRMGCRRFQGYYYSRPLPMEQISALLEADQPLPATG